MYKDRYIRNKILKGDEQQLLQNSKVVVFGLGGLGGYVVEGLARMGVGELVILDMDVFSESNLNRQRFCVEDNIGKGKAEETKKALEKINSEVEVLMIDKKLTEKEINELLQDKKIKVVVDCLDSKRDKLLLEKICERQNKIMIHGAISGWIGQVATICPSDRLLESIYGDKKDIEDEWGNPSFTPMVVAGLQVSETIKALIYKEVIHNKMLYIDLRENDFVGI